MWIRTGHFAIWAAMVVLYATGRIQETWKGAETTLGQNLGELSSQAAHWPITQSSLAILFQETNFRMGSKGFKTEEKEMTDCQPPTNTPTRFMYVQILQELT